MMRTTGRRLPLNHDPIENLIFSFEISLEYKIIAKLFASSVKLRRHHTEKIMRWTPGIISKDNAAVTQIVGNNIVAADMV